MAPDPIAVRAAAQRELQAQLRRTYAECRDTMARFAAASQRMKRALEEARINRDACMEQDHHEVETVRIKAANRGDESLSP